MIATLLNQLGAWSWMVLGLVLLGIEILVPGVFMLWIGIAAIITGVISLLLWEMPFWTWQVQLLVFGVFVIVAIVAGRRIMSSGARQTDEPLLNRRGEQLIGRSATLTEPVVNGQGRMRLDDTTWRISGPDLPSGSRVKVVPRRYAADRGNG
jgi:membrane protein implicated in regulation of membrane protease activity